MLFLVCVGAPPLGPFALFRANYTTKYFKTVRDLLVRSLYGMPPEYIETLQTYIRGELPSKEVEKLWESFLRDPERFYYFLTLLYISKR